MKFSVCIPNYNYEKYLGKTMQSVLDQTYNNFELLICDNASTDGSVEVIKSFIDPRIQLVINRCNVGFAGNLDCVARMATGDVLLMLSSDDLMTPNALETYYDLYHAIEHPIEDVIISSNFLTIDSDDNELSSAPLPRYVWREDDRAMTAEKQIQMSLFSVPSIELLKRCLLHMQNPFNFLATAYSRETYERVGGYGGGRLMNPDKWFHWKILNHTKQAYFIDQPLFRYRWHESNQTANQEQSGALKFLVDEYISTFQVEQSVLDRLSLNRDQLIDAFIEYDVANHGLATLAKGNRVKAKRVLKFAESVYERHVWRNRKAWALGFLLRLGPIGQMIAAGLYQHSKREEN